MRLRDHRVIAIFVIGVRDTSKGREGTTGEGPAPCGTIAGLDTLAADVTRSGSQLVLDHVAAHGCALAGACGDAAVLAPRRDDLRQPRRVRRRLCLGHHPDIPGVRWRSIGPSRPVSKRERRAGPNRAHSRALPSTRRSGWPRPSFSLLSASRLSAAFATVTMRPSGGGNCGRQPADYHSGTARADRSAGAGPARAVRAGSPTLRRRPDWHVHCKPRKRCPSGPV